VLDAPHGHDVVSLVRAARTTRATYRLVLIYQGLLNFEQSFLFSELLIILEVRYG
jgi:hypothetical protein